MSRAAEQRHRLEEQLQAANERAVGLERQLAECQAERDLAREELRFNKSSASLWCPKCVGIFHESREGNVSKDKPEIYLCGRCGTEVTARYMDANPDEFWECPYCHVIQHAECRGPLAPTTEAKELVEERDATAAQAAEQRRALATIAGNRLNDTGECDGSCLEDAVGSDAEGEGNGACSLCVACAALALTPADALARQQRREQLQERIMEAVRRWQEARERRKEKDG